MVDLEYLVAIMVRLETKVKATADKIKTKPDTIVSTGQEATNAILEIQGAAS
jgi:hypothetical protein